MVAWDGRRRPLRARTWIQTEESAKHSPQAIGGFRTLVSMFEEAILLRSRTGRLQEHDVY